MSSPRFQLTMTTETLGSPLTGSACDAAARRMRRPREAAMLSR